MLPVVYFSQPSSSSLSLSLNFDNDSLVSLSSFFSYRLLPTRFSRKRSSFEDHRRFILKCTLAKAKDRPSPIHDLLIREPHKYFDQVVITVRSGDGGHGAILSMPDPRASSKSQGKLGKGKMRKKSSYKRDFDGSLILPMGGHGGDVVIYADEGKDSLLEFPRKSRHNAKRGGNVDAMGVLTSQLHDGLPAPTLRIPVPLGTVVKLKRGKFLADLAHPGDEVLVARGGQGGISLLEMPEHRRKKLMALTTNAMRDENDKFQGCCRCILNYMNQVDKNKADVTISSLVLVLGQPGEEVSLQLILRVVADVGLVGLPNAGKSTLLAAITRAKPGIADYPFTTLMPNLGRLDGDPNLGVEKYSSQATLADLPGLIEGAHLGKGLGRNFLRHLRRTRLLVLVVDAAADDPINDYRTVKEELRMYNPDYLERPYVVVLNKIDIPQAMARLPTLVEEIWRIGSDWITSPLGTSSENASQSLFNDREHNNATSSGVHSDRKAKEIEEYPRPVAVVDVSVLKGTKINEMLKEIRAALRKCLDSNEALAH